MRDTYRTEAIVLTVKDWREADRLVTLFSVDNGKIKTVAYGARKVGSKLAGALQPFNHLDMAIERGKDIDIVRQCEVRTSFRDLRADYMLLAYAAMIAELTMEMFPDRQPDPNVFNLLHNTLNILTARNPRVVAAAGAWQLIDLAGFRPELVRCASCRGILSYPARFSCSAGGAICAGCSGDNLFEFKTETAVLLSRLLDLDLSRPERFIVNAAALTQVEQLFSAYSSSILNSRLRTLTVLRQMLLGGY